VSKAIRALAGLTLLAAVLGCDLRRGFRPSGFLQGLKPEVLLTRVWPGLGSAPLPGSTSWGTSPSSATRDFRHAVEVNEEEREAFMTALRDHVESELVAARCRINGRGKSGDVVDFSFDYVSPTSEGEIHVWSVLDKDGNVTVIGMVHEFSR